MTAPIANPASAMLGQPSVQTMASPASTAPVLPAQQVPQTGLIGSEQAILGGFQGAYDALQNSTGEAKGYYQNLLGGLDSPVPTGSSGVPSNFNISVSGGGGSGGGFNTTLNPNDTANLNSAVNNFSGYLGGGTSAAKMQADLSGANGPEAQQAAYTAYQSSPAMKYQMDQMQKSVERSAAARGGALGGNVLLELQKNAAGIASQDYQNQFNNLGAVSTQGLNAAAQVGNIRSNQAQIGAGLQQAGISADASIQNAQIGAGAQLQAQAMSSGTQLEAQRMANENQRYIQNRDLKAQVADRLASLASNAGINTAGLFSQTGQQLSSGRTNAGQAIAANANQAATNIGNLIAQQGINISNEMATDISNTTKMLYDYGMQDKISNEQLAAIIANITGGQATNAQNAYGNIGAANAAGTMGASNAVQGGLTQALMLGGASKNASSAYNPNAASSVGTINNGSSVGAYA